MQYTVPLCQIQCKQTWMRRDQTTLSHRVGECSYDILFQYGCIVSSSSDGSVKVWSQKGTEITTLHGHTQCANDAALLVSVSKETMVDEGGYPQWFCKLFPLFVCICKESLDKYWFYRILWSLTFKVKGQRFELRILLNFWQSGYGRIFI